jgi:hypothetical protein
MGFKLIAIANIIVIQCLLTSHSTYRTSGHGWC